MKEVFFGVEMERIVFGLPMWNYFTVNHETGLSQ
jgi:hypothetical protein